MRLIFVVYCIPTNGTGNIILQNLFASKQDLDHHNISAHQNKKQFKCNPCKVGFTSKQALNQHISSIHQGKRLAEQWKNQIASLLTSED